MLTEYTKKEGPAGHPVLPWEWPRVGTSTAGGTADQLMHSACCRFIRETGLRPLPTHNRTFAVLFTGAKLLVRFQVSAGKA